MSPGDGNLAQFVTIVKSEDNTENKSDVVVYADDNSPTTSNEDPEELMRVIEKDAKNITDWFSKNKMVCSGEKTKLLISGTRANKLKLDPNQEIVEMW